MKRLARRSLTLIALSATFLPEAWAGKVYWEFGAGVASITAGEPLLGTGTPASLGIGSFLNLGLGYATATDSSASALHFALNGKMNSGSSETNHYSVLSLYPIMRLATRKLAIELGATPLLWTRVAASFGFDGLAAATGAIGATAGVSYESVLNPQASLIWSANAEAFQSTTGVGPRPILNFGLMIRLNMGGPTQFSDRTGPPPLEEYKGWRYPMGRPL